MKILTIIACCVSGMRKSAMINEGLTSQSDPVWPLTLEVADYVKLIAIIGALITMCLV